MALTKEILIQQEALKGLPDGAITAITTLSQNDENATIAHHRSEWWNKLDGDIKDIFGEEKPHNVKSYEHLREVLKKAKEGAGSAGELKNKLEALESEKKALQGQIKAGAGDAALKSRVEELEKAVADEKSRVQQLQAKYDQTRKEMEAKVSEKDKELGRLQVMHEFDRALAGKKPKPGISEDIYREIKENRVDALLNRIHPEWDKANNGQKVLRLRDKDGNLMNDPDDLQNPYTAERLVLKELADVLDMGKKQNGAGTGASPGTGAGSFSSHSAKTKVEATELIRSALMQKGISTSHPQFQSKFDEAWKDMNAAELPLQ